MNFSVPACLDEKAAVWDGSRNANAPDFSVSLISVGFFSGSHGLYPCQSRQRSAWIDKKGQIAEWGRMRLSTSMD